MFGQTQGGQLDWLERRSLPDRVAFTPQFGVRLTTEITHEKVCYRWYVIQQNVVTMLASRHNGMRYFVTLW